MVNFDPVTENLGKPHRCNWGIRSTEILPLIPQSMRGVPLQNLSHFPRARCPSSARDRSTFFCAHNAADIESAGYGHYILRYIHPSHIHSTAGFRLTGLSNWTFGQAGRLDLETPLAHLLTHSLHLIQYQKTKSRD